MKALIIAGGRGTRMGKITEKIPKPMIKIGGLPILEHQINLLKRYNIKDIIILTNYLSEVIEDYFEDGKKFGVKISYFKEKMPFGTAGGIKEIENTLKDNFIVIYGDIMLDVDIKQLLKFHRKKNSDCTIVLHPNDHPYDSDLVEIDENQMVMAFHPKPHKDGEYFRNLDNACLYVITPKVLRYIEKGVSADFGKDIFPKIYKKIAMYGYNTAEYLKDVGTPIRLKEVKKDFRDGKINKFNKKNKRKAIFLDRDGTINDATEDVKKIEDFKLYSFSAEAIKKINNSDYLAIVITNQPVIAKGMCSIEELDMIHKKMETLLGRHGAKVDAIYYCPHHPDKGFVGENKKYKIECDCRKPKIGLIKRAQKDFNIDIKKSYFIGDSFRDADCAKNAGATFIGVKTGDACKDCKTKTGFMAKDMLSAINFIIKK